MPLDTTTLPSAKRRESACKLLLHQTHAILAPEGVTPSALHAIKQKVVALAKRSDLFPFADFPMPETEGRNHILQVEDNDGLGLYLTIALPGKIAAPHAHGVWCVNAAISGKEEHVMWRRTDDGSQPGRATIMQIGAVTMQPGNGFAMADHEIHSTSVIGDEPLMALALYGYALARFPSVIWYHHDFGTLRAMPSRRESVPA
jgi:predicted metal-dependent enzyme (double-stranded beta helix superfamily)